MVQTYQIHPYKNEDFPHKTSYLLVTPRHTKKFETFDEVKTAFNRMKKARNWVLFCKEADEYITYTNQPDAHKGCIICNKIQLQFKGFNHV